MSLIRKSLREGRVEKREREGRGGKKRKGGGRVEKREREREKTVREESG